MIDPTDPTRPITMSMPPGYYQNDANKCSSLRRSPLILSSFADLRAAKLALYESSEKAISAKVALDKKRSKLLAGSIVETEALAAASYSRYCEIAVIAFSTDQHGPRIN